MKEMQDCIKEEIKRIEQKYKNGEPTTIHEDNVYYSLQEYQRNLENKNPVCVACGKNEAEHNSIVCKECAR